MLKMRGKGCASVLHSCAEQLFSGVKMTKKSHLIDAGLSSDLSSGGPVETVSGKNQFSRREDSLLGRV